VNLLIHNQLQTLGMLDREIRRQEAALRRLYAAVAPSFEDVFLTLRLRSTRQHRVLRLVAAVSIAGLVLAHIVYVFVTDPARSWLCALLGTCR